jgi:hypothetical protein
MIKISYKSIIIQPVTLSNKKDQDKLFKYQFMSLDKLKGNLHQNRNKKILMR